jgi:Na+/melibiose symporter-like transporter
MVGHTDSVFKQKINLGNSCWSLVCAFTCALLVTRFKRRTMYLCCTCSLLVVYICWTVTMQQAMSAIDNGGQNKAAGTATIFFIFLYSPAYNLGYNALTYTYLVELWPFAERSRGIAIFQFFGRGAGFFTTFVNPIGLDNIRWKYLITYCCWLAFEIVFVWFFFPETAGRTLEELAFCKFQTLSLLSFRLFVHMSERR